MKSSIFRREEELLNITKELLKKNNLSEDNIVSFISGYEKLLKHHIKQKAKILKSCHPKLDSPQK